MKTRTSTPKATADTIDILAGRVDNVVQLAGSFSNPSSRRPTYVDTIAALQALSTVGLPDGALFVTKGYYAVSDGGGATYNYSASSSATDDGGSVIAPTAGTGRYLLQVSESINVRQFGAKGDGTGDDSAAINAAILYVEGIGGGSVFFKAGNYSVTSQISISSSKVRLFGEGLSSSITYTGTARIAQLLYVGASANEGVSISNMRLAGGAYQAGKTKYVVVIEAFGRNCVLENVLIREGLGLLRVNSSYYASFRGVTLTQSVPDPEDQGWSLADWQDVYSSTSAPIYFGGNGGAMVINRMTIGTVGSETHTGNTGVNLILFNTASGMVNSMSVETCSVGYDTFTPTTTNIIQVKSSWLQVNNLYMEHVGAVSRCIYAHGRTQLTLNQPLIYRFVGGASSSLLVNDSASDFVVRDAIGYRINAKRLQRTESSFGGTSQDFVFENCIFATGERYTDPTINADQHNLYDTYGTVNLLGLEESNLQRLNPRESVFPQINYGLTVTNSSDANGHYVQVASGILWNNIGKIVQNKMPTATTSSSTFVVYRLRPTSASKYYRLYVGYGGNLYLTESSSAFSDDRGNWLAEFQTDGSTAITGLASNPRLGYRGKYDAGLATFSSTSAPSSGRWVQGDKVMFSAPTAGGYIGSVCTVAGSPGTWKSFGAVLS